MNHINSEKMANREELGIIRGARAGDAVCQLALGKLYLFGGASLPLSLPTALHWLNRAALQEQDEAWMLIGSHVPFEHAQHCLPTVLSWYDRAYDAGVAQAGLVLAQLVLDPTHDAADTGHLRDKALRALEAAAHAGSAEAQWLLAHQPGARPPAPLPSRAQPASRGAVPLPAGRGSVRQQWLACAADGGLAAAQYAVLDQAWHGERDVFLQRALPLLGKLLAGAPPDAEAARLADWPLTPAQLTLLSRCAELRGQAAGRDAGDDALLHQAMELAAHGGERNAQLALGLWFARMDGDGRRQSKGIAAVNFKRAIRWLTLAGEQGLAEAWFALSRIYLKPEFSQRCVAEAQGYLERAAEMGHCNAQLECGMYAWRNRRTEEQSDVRAAYWLQKAAAQGCDEAEAALARVAAAPRELDWTGPIMAGLSRELLESQPLLAARLELAALFGLSRAEALLLDVHAADQGHCLVVDIRASYGRSKRRLVLLRTARERQALDRIVRVFDAIDSGPDGLEGNYRQRLYRLKTWLLSASAADDRLAA
jgi:TPR repeat protein